MNASSMLFIQFVNKVEYEIIQKLSNVCHETFHTQIL